ncbi:MAG: myo-inosose-2 dehydratase [Stellaceae bacterium]
MSVRLGVSPIGWSNDDLPELGGDIPLGTCLAEARKAGFKGIELGHKFPREPALLQSLLAHHELQLVSGWYSGRLLERSATEELEAIEPHRALLAAMGCAVLVYAETSGGIAGDRTRPLSSRPSLPDGDWRDFGIRLTELADRLAERDIRLAYHHHVGTVVETTAEIDRLMAATGGSVGLLLDTGHLAFAGADPADIAWRHRRRINHVHCKDVRADVLARARTADESFLDAVLDGIFTVPGDGAIDFPAVVNALKVADYRGWLVVEAEQDPAKAPPLVYARRGFAHLNAAVRETGW